jgi:nitroreductase
MEPSGCWTAFCAANQERRAIRDFDGTPLSDDDVRAILEQALLAPSSGNLQPYQLHWVRDPAMKATVAAACGDQKAAKTAATLLVVAAAIETAVDTAAAHLAYVEASAELDEKSKHYHRRQHATGRRFLRLASMAVCAPVHALLSLLYPPFTLLPIGPAAVRHWVARSSIYAAQTLMLAAAARGVDSCPMEGFNARKVAKILQLPRGTVIPIIVALGIRRIDARLEPQWRRPFDKAVVVHTVNKIVQMTSRA